MSVSESEIYQAGLALPPSVRRQVALRLLESVEPEENVDDEAETWLHTEVAAAHDALRADPSRAIPDETVRAQFEAKWTARS